MSKITESKLSLEEAKQIQKNFRLLAAVAMVYISIGTIAMMFIEKYSFVDSLYFSVVSLTTVGYGDYSPSTTAGKFFVMFYLLGGIGIIAALANNIMRNAMARKVINDSANNEDEQ